MLSHFAVGRRAVFFGATQQAESIELRRLAESVRRDLGASAADLAGGAFSDWESALRFMLALSKQEPLTVVLDEVPYLTRSTPGFASIVQVVWDHIDPGNKILLVLVGSAVGVIADMLGADGALRGRPTLRMHLQPLDVIAAQEFLPQLDPSQLFEAYAACGGYPLHLRKWDQQQSTQANLMRLAGRSGGILREDAESILWEELARPGGYAQILAAIGRGATRFGEIANAAGQRIEHPLRVLADAGFVTREVPLGAPRRARPSYQIADPYLRFWFNVLYSDLALIDAGQGDAVLRRAESRWQKHIGHCFEAACRAHAERLVQSGELPRDLVLGRWWSSRGPSVEVDVLGLRGRRAALLGEAKWSDRPLDVDTLEALRAKVGLTPDPIDNPQLVLWGRSGATGPVRQSGALAFDCSDVLTRQS